MSQRRSPKGAAPTKDGAAAADESRPQAGSASTPTASDKPKGTSSEGTSAWNKPGTPTGSRPSASASSSSANGKAKVPPKQVGMNIAAMAARNLGGFVPNKIFVGGVPITCMEDQFKAYFEPYGGISKVELHALRGFGYITYDTVEAVDACLEKYDEHYLCKKWVEVKRSIPRELIDAYEREQRRLQAEYDGTSDGASPDPPSTSKAASSPTAPTTSTAGGLPAPGGIPGPGAPPAARKGGGYGAPAAGGWGKGAGHAGPIKQLTDMGFPEAVAKRVLSECVWDVNKAIDRLLTDETLLASLGAEEDVAEIAAEPASEEAAEVAEAEEAAEEASPEPASPAPAPTSAWGKQPAPASPSRGAWGKAAPAAPEQSPFTAPAAGGSVWGPKSPSVSEAAPPPAKASAWGKAGSPVAGSAWGKSPSAAPAPKAKKEAAPKAPAKSGSVTAEPMREAAPADAPDAARGSNGVKSSPPAAETSGAREVDASAAPKTEPTGSGTAPPYQAAVAPAGGASAAATPVVEEAPAPAPPTAQANQVIPVQPSAPPGRHHAPQTQAPPPPSAANAAPAAAAAAPIAEPAPAAQSTAPESAPDVPVPRKRIERVTRSWDAEDISQLGVTEHEFVNVWVDTKTDHGWIHAERRSGGPQIGWLPICILQDLFDRQKRWMAAKQAWQAKDGSQCSCVDGGVVIVWTETRTDAGWTYVEAEDEHKQMRQGWLPVFCIDWNED